MWSQTVEFSWVSSDDAGMTPINWITQGPGGGVQPWPINPPNNLIFHSTVFDITYTPTTSTNSFAIEYMTAPYDLYNWTYLIGPIAVQANQQYHTVITKTDLNFSLRDTYSLYINGVLSQTPMLYLSNDVVATYNIKITFNYIEPPIIINCI